MKNRIISSLVVFLFFSFVLHAQNDWKVSFFDKGVLTTKRNLTYNNLGFLVEEKVTFPLIEKRDIITYAYNFDDNANWIQKIKYVNSVPVNMKERTITYF